MAFTNVEFEIDPKIVDGMRFVTHVNGDLLELRNLELDAEQASAVAYLVNQSKKLKVEIKIIP